MPTPDEQQAYERGKVAGELAAKVAEKGQHLDKINGSMEKVATALANLVIGVKGIEQQMAADKETRVATAQALKDAEDARRHLEDDRRTEDDQKWSPLARVVLLVSALSGLAGLIYLIANH